MNVTRRTLLTAAVFGPILARAATTPCPPAIVALDDKPLDPTGSCGPNGGQITHGDQLDINQHTGPWSLHAYRGAASR